MLLSIYAPSTLENAARLHASSQRSTLFAFSDLRALQSAVRALRHLGGGPSPPRAATSLLTRLATQTLMHLNCPHRGGCGGCGSGTGALEGGGDGECGSLAVVWGSPLAAALLPAEGSALRLLFLSRRAAGPVLAPLGGCCALGGALPPRCLRWRVVLCARPPAVPPHTPFSGRLLLRERRLLALRDTFALASTLGGGWFLTRHLHEALRLARQSLRLAAALGDASLWGSAALHVAYICFQCARWRAGAIFCRQLAAFAAREGDARLAAMVAAARGYLRRCRAWHRAGKLGSNADAHRQQVVAVSAEDAKVLLGGLLAL